MGHSKEGQVAFNAKGLGFIFSSLDPRQAFWLTIVKTRFLSTTTSLNSHEKMGETKNDDVNLFIVSARLGALLPD